MSAVSYLNWDEIMDHDLALSFLHIFSIRILVLEIGTQTSFQLEIIF